jgi:preprotein translocase subunit SecE
MNNIISYIQEAYQEFSGKVTWPTFAELQSSAVLVLVASMIIAMLVWAMDITSNNVATAIYNTLMSIGG